VLGGKARSIPVPNSADEGRMPLPGEHGFRLFHGFHKHVTITTPHSYGTHGSTFDNLALAMRILPAGPKFGLDRTDTDHMGSPVA
jgi:hypothetical protein